MCVERAHTEAYCAALHVPCVQDETNQGDAYARNRLRHHALPAMQSVNPQAVAAMGRFCRQMAQVDAYFAAKAETLLQGARVQGGWRTEPLCSAEPPVRAAALLRLTADVCEPSEPMVRRAERLLQTGQGAVQLAPGALLRAQGGLIWLEQAAGHSLPPQPFGPGEYRLPGGFGLRVELLEYKSFAKIPCVHKKDLNYAADYAKIQDNVLLRTRKPGDRFSPRGRGLTKTLKRYLNEQKVPLAQRALLPLAARGGQVLWLWGAGFAEGLAPGPATRQVLRVTQLELEDV